MGNETSKTGGQSSGAARSSATAAHPRTPATAPQPTASKPPPPPQSAPATQRTSAPMAISTSANQRTFLVSADAPVSVSMGNNNNINTEAVGSSVPRYVDANSMVYTLPSFTSETSLGSTAGMANGGGSGGVAGSPHRATVPLSSSIRGTGAAAATIGATVSAPVPLSAAAMGSTNEFRLHAPSSPLSPSRRHFPGGSVSSPIAIPTYNTATTSAVEELSCSSPVLRSYRQHSFSTSKRDMCMAKSPTSPPITFFGASSFTQHSADAPPIMLASSLTTSVPGGSVGTGGAAAIHTKFLEITGHPLGLENYGNTCYCNSVIQLIYHCTPLRLRLLELHDVYQLKKGKPGFEEDTVLCQLCSLIAVMHKSNNRSKEKYPREKIAPKELLQCVSSKNEIFNNTMQQDAHEFTMFLLNDITETEQRIMADPNNANVFLQHEASMKKKGSSFSFWKHSKDKTISANSQKVAGAAGGKSDKTAAAAAAAAAGGRAASPGGQPFSGDLTPLQVILQGQFGSLTACLECENVTARDEVFIDLSLETKQGCSLLRCLDHFGDPEYFWGKNKLRCDECKRAVRAAKTIHVQQLPQYALLVHLKRFQYDVKKQNFTKKADHVALPMQMDVEEYLTDPEVLEQNLRKEQARSQRDNNSSGTGKRDDAAPASAASPDSFKLASEEVQSKLRGVARHKARFELTGFVAHIGEGPNSGHYFTCVRYGPQLWRRFDDENVSTMAERDVQQYFGVPSDATGVVTTTAYILLYERMA